MTNTQDSDFHLWYLATAAEDSEVVKEKGAAERQHESNVQNLKDNIRRQSKLVEQRENKVGKEKGDAMLTETLRDLFENQSNCIKQLLTHIEGISRTETANKAKVSELEALNKHLNEQVEDMKKAHSQKENQSTQERPGGREPPKGYHESTDKIQSMRLQLGSHKESNVQEQLWASLQDALGDYETLQQNSQLLQQNVTGQRQRLQELQQESQSLQQDMVLQDQREQQLENEKQSLQDILSRQKRRVEQLQQDNQSLQQDVARQTQREQQLQEEKQILQNEADVLEQRHQQLSKALQESKQHVSSAQERNQLLEQDVGEAKATLLQVQQSLGETEDRGYQLADHLRAVSEKYKLKIEALQMTTLQEDLQESQKAYKHLQECFQVACDRYKQALSAIEERDQIAGLLRVDIDMATQRLVLLLERYQQDE
ncbi:hypothetical protein K491DRAFT_782194 [Lophiostoma macrostomum CBS 122681]|uniref:Uncharacterized protein n=1 Tax=Lophiostoma macrostomum CBS 122681 TaxID=1314788 RepID=A0A6A6SXV1_9PLEO|nr:hypothetical protein K491DRAFT_782194 [Lophiostoma macrostomum CBS 122681]